VNIGIYEDMTKPITLYSSIKSINAQFYILAGIYAKEKKYDDVLLLNNDGYIIEATSSNVFFVKDNIITTPSLASGCVSGIMRNKVIGLIEKLGYKINFNNININYLQNCDEIFLTNAIVGVKYISGYKEKRFSKKISLKLINELNHLLQSNLHTPIK
jgi:branched-chain amino acid aminotransferase